ncbi:hypothetical protein OOJ91_34075 [Micromonospora lupini]|uniref:hypothetical protein n=1 Tax=Micromonospora lupini TaxID=285679 RepID=UPI00225659E9|nr:hypothetical protein [Micromonospora lupini]MCX5070877.1 hypothetical protein [Micromonospora lupini]
MSTPYTEGDVRTAEMALAAIWSAPGTTPKQIAKAVLDALASGARFAPPAADVDRARQVRDSILANARADADRAHRMHDEASDEVDRLTSDRRQLHTALRDLANRLDLRGRNSDAPSDGIAMCDFADEIRALTAPGPSTATRSTPAGPGATAKTSRPQDWTEALVLLAVAWTAADHTRRTRALTNAGPITLAKVDGAAARAAAGLPAKGMPLPDHTIRDRRDPRIPAWAATVAHRMEPFDTAQLAEAFYWTTAAAIRHVTADLLCDQPTTRLVANLGDLAETLRLVEVASRSRILHADVSFQPHPVLSATVAIEGSAQL